MQKIFKLIKGMIFKEEEIDVTQQEDEDLRFCDLCEKGKAMRHVQKHVEL